MFLCSWLHVASLLPCMLDAKVANFQMRDYFLTYLISYDKSMFWMGHYWRLAYIKRF